MSAAESKLNFTPGDSKIIMSIMRHIKTLDTDWDAVTRDCGYANKTVTTTRWGQVKKKILGFNGGGGSGDNSSTNGITKSNGNTKKRAAPVADGEGSKKRGRKTKAVAQEQTRDDEEVKEDMKMDSADSAVKGEPDE